MGCNHTPEPVDYVAWHSWADEMAKTHRQVRCPNCGLWAVWVPKRPGRSAPIATPERTCIVVPTAGRTGD